MVKNRLKEIKRFDPVVFIDKSINVKLPVLKPNKDNSLSQYVKLIVGLLDYRVRVVL